MFLYAMSDRPASWRMPNPKQMEKLAADASRITLAEPEAGSEMPEEYWQAVFADPRLQGSRGGRAQPSVAPGQVLRIDCRRCERLIEIQTDDALRLYGQNVSAGEVGRKVLGSVCEMRTGHHEEDGCWPTVRVL
jgi:hypothetical protein